jgi:hypothetical protein
MIPGPYRPKCESLVFRKNLLSGNTCGATLFSDGKQIAPMLPEFPAIVKCSACNVIFWINDKNKIGEREPHRLVENVKAGKAKGSSIAKFMSTDEYQEAIDLKIYKNKKELKFLRVMEENIKKLLREWL